MIAFRNCFSRAIPEAKAEEPDTISVHFFTWL